MVESRSRFASLILTLSFLSSAAFAQAGMALAPGDKAPLMRGRTHEQKFLKTDYPAHRLTLVNFWAPWCVPCKAEMLALQKLHDVHEAGGLAVIGVLYDSASEEEVRKFAEGLGITYPLVRPHGGYTRKWSGLAVLPATFLVDQKGVLLRKYVGATAEQIVGLVYDVEEAMAGRPLGPFIMPEDPIISTDEDRIEHNKQQKSR
jgi:thiol-disulfide isomerase/thioredoxin